MGLLKDGAVSYRQYQYDIARRVLEKGSTLVIMPTGLGKTIIAVLVAAKMLEKSGKKILILAPTKPLAEQHLKKIAECIGASACMITGQTAVEGRSALWDKAQVIAATPQTAQNDLLTGKLKLEQFQLVVFDEAHRATGDYAYVFLARECAKRGIVALGLTASPGASRERIEGICKNLHVNNVEIRSEADADVVPYVKGVGVEWVEVQLPQEFGTIKQDIEDMMRDSARSLKEAGYLQSAELKGINKRRLLALRGMISADLPRRSAYAALSETAALLILYHAHELLETQGVGALRDFFAAQQAKDKKSKALKRILADARAMRVAEAATALSARNVEHPKMEKLREIVRRELERSEKIIVFTNYRGTAEKICEALSGVAKPVKVIGQGKEDGLSQREQLELLQKFRDGEYNVLVGTQVLEEGLDIKSVDAVVFYESVPSEIRSIQRRGRTGRLSVGRVIALITKGTRDEAYYWIAKHREKHMRAAVKSINRRIEQSTLSGW